MSNLGFESLSRSFHAPHYHGAFRVLRGSVRQSVRQRGNDEPDLANVREAIEGGAVRIDDEDALALLARLEGDDTGHEMGGAIR